jgi:D-alanyl-D-alanine dipeptidase
LRRVMTDVGYKPLRSEWWHFNFRSREEAKRNYKVIR